MMDSGRSSLGSKGDRTHAAAGGGAGTGGVGTWGTQFPRTCVLEGKCRVTRGVSAFDHMQ